MSPSKLTLTINEGKEGAEITGIPSDVWERFKVNAKKQFPASGDDAWANFLSEAILSVGGGTHEVMTYFLTDVPVQNADALEKRFHQASWQWDEFHTYLLQSALIDKALRVIGFKNEDGTRSPGTLIITGLRNAAFEQIEKKTGRTFEQVMGMFFHAASTGTVEVTGTFPPE